MKKLLSMLIASLFGFAYANGTHSFKVGDIELIALKVVDSNMDKSILLNPDDEIVQKVMSDNQNPSSVNTFLLKTKDELILIDTGYESKGDLIKNLKAVGVTTEQINTILITHMHGDHIGGLINEGKKVFENAKVLIAKDELQYWLNKHTKRSELAKEVNSIYGQSVQTFSWNENISANIKPLKAVGHTPGHTFFEITSNGEKIVIVADVVHVLSVQVAKPSMSVVYDTDPIQAAKTREEYFKKFADEKTKIAGMHIKFPGVGYILENGKNSYKFEAVE